MVLAAYLKSAWTLFPRLVGSYLLLAAIGKVLQPLGFYRVLYFDGVTAPTAQYLTAILLTTVETFVGIGLLFHPGKPHFLYASLFLFASFILQLALLHLLNGPELCGCLGGFAWLFPQLNKAGGIVLDSCIFTGLLWALRLSRAQSSRNSAPLCDSTPCTRRIPGGNFGSAGIPSDAAESSSRKNI